MPAEPRSRLAPWLLATVLLVLLAPLGCSGTTQRPAATAVPGPPAPAAATSRVLLLSLDGASAQTLHQLYSEGRLAAGGFARFFREGQVADAIIPVNPTLTATNHISIVTGYSAGATGIVSNNFHLPGSAWGSVVSGFDAAIATDTLWEAMQRQGRKVGSIAWPGADGRDERRRASWGMTYAKTERPAALLTLTRRDWKPLDIPPGTPFARSYAPVLAAHVDLPGSPAPSPADTGAEGLDLFALDSADDGVVRYDRLVVLPRPHATAISALANVAGETLAAGQWLRLLIPAETSGTPTASPGGLWVKVLAIEPSLARVRLYFGNVGRLAAYPAEFAAALAARGLVWPGEPDDARLRLTWQGQPGIDLATWSEQNDRFAEFFGASLRAAAARADWGLLLGYTPVLDEAGHTLLLLDPRQPGFSPALQEACEAGRLRAWQTVDRELGRLLAEVDLATTRVVVVSDHGMSPVHTAVDPAVLLLGQGYLAANGQGRVQPEKTTVLAVSDGGISHLYLAPRVSSDPAERDRLLADLRILFTHWKVDGRPPVARVLTRREAAEVGLDHPNSGDLILFAAEGYVFSASADLRERRAAVPTTSYGRHGYLNSNPDMRGIYMALGAGVPAGTTAVAATEVAGRIAAWLGIEKPRPFPVVPGNAPTGL